MIPPASPRSHASIALPSFALAPVLRSGHALLDDLGQQLDVRRRVDPAALLVERDRPFALAALADVGDQLRASHRRPLLAVYVPCVSCHKWLCAPKGSGFLYARPERQALLEPLVAGWGYGRSGFALQHDWESTRDPAAYLSVPAAIEFVREHGRAEACRELLARGAEDLAAAGFEAFVPRQPLQMASFRLPSGEPETIQSRLLAEFGIEVPVRRRNGEVLLRVSVAPYTTPADLDRLRAALATVFSPELGA